MTNPPTPLGADIEKQIEDSVNLLLEEVWVSIVKDIGTSPGIAYIFDKLRKTTAQQILALLESSNKASRISELDKIRVAFESDKGWRGESKAYTCVKDRLKELSAEGEQK